DIPFDSHLGIVLVTLNKRLNQRLYRRRIERRQECWDGLTFVRQSALRRHLAARGYDAAFNRRMLEHAIVRLRQDPVFSARMPRPLRLAARLLTWSAVTAALARVPPRFQTPMEFVLSKERGRHRSRGKDTVKVMARVMLVQPWNFHDEGVGHEDLINEWRNAPYSIVLLGTMLRDQGHEVRVVDLIERLITNRGNLRRTLDRLGDEIWDFRPDIFGVGFFSIHYIEVLKLVQFARDMCRRAGVRTKFIAGGIHASTEPMRTLRDLDFDYVFVGEAEISLSKFCDGVDPKEIKGVIARETPLPAEAASPGGRTIIPLEVQAAGPARLGTLTFDHKAETLEDLDSLPYPDYSLVNYRFYAQPNRAKFRRFEAKSLDIIMGRGCVYRCAFCAYNALSSVRFHSAAYLAGEVEYLQANFGIDSFYFMDSTIGNNQPLLYRLCDEFERSGLYRQIRWNGCMRPNQINRPLLTRLIEA